MEVVAGPFSLQDILKGTLSQDAANIQTTLFQDANTLRQIKQRERTFPALNDPMIRHSTENELQDTIRNYQKNFLPAYQKAVEELLGKKEDIQKKVEEKRKAGESAPNEGETKSALDDAAQKLQEAIKEQPAAQKTFSTIQAFFEKAKPYVGPLVSAAKIALKLLAL
jgi:vacuolar-type H+-ATPase catalytic subunit A/Vma1